MDYPAAYNSHRELSVLTIVLKEMACGGKCKGEIKEERV
jgi:hypothetical protein